MLRPGIQPPTYVRDGHNRLFIVRSSLSEVMVRTWLPEMAKQVPQLMGETYVPPKQRRANLRGPHMFTIYGHDRQNKKVLLDCSLTKACNFQIILYLTRFLVLLPSTEPGTTWRFLPSSTILILFFIK